MEAVIGAVHQDGGWVLVKELILRLMEYPFRTTADARYSRMFQCQRNLPGTDAEKWWGTTHLPMHRDLRAKPMTEIIHVALLGGIRNWPAGTEKSKRAAEHSARSQNLR